MFKYPQKPVHIQLPIQNFEAQETIFSQKSRYTVVPKGRRFGLTKGAANDFILSALEKKFSKGLWIDTVNTNIDRYIERYFLPHLKKLPQDWWSWRKQDKIVMITGAYIDFRSSDRPENIEGFGYDKFFINEAGIVLKDPYLWSNAIRPMLWDYKARGVIGGTPKGKGVFFELAEKGWKPNDMYTTLRFSSFNNPYLDQQLIKDEIKDMPERVVLQEIYAQFLDDSGIVFRKVKDIMNATPQGPVMDHIYVIGVDLAKVTDFTVITVYDRTNNCQVYQDRFNTLDWNLQKAKIKAVSKHYNNALCIVDATGIGDPIVDDLVRAGVPVEPIKLTNEQKKEMIEKLIIWIEQKKIWMLPLDDTLKEFTNFTYDISITGKTRYSAPEGLHDDIVISHSLAIWALNPLYQAIKQREDTLIEKIYKEQLSGRTKQNYAEYNPSSIDFEQLED